jgi:hypothetical protein
MNLSDFHFFDISFQSFNLFSYMIGMTVAFFNQSFFGKKIGREVIFYFACLAAWYAFSYHNLIS